MNEPFDVEISRALKESSSKELQGWEFSPAMRASVMEKIRAEEAGTPAPADPGRSRFNPAPLLRPLAWAAVAAAAFLVVVNVGLPGMGSKKAEEAAQKMAPAAATAPAQDAAVESTSLAAGGSQEGARSFTTAQDPAMATAPKAPPASNRLTVPEITPDAVPPATLAKGAPGSEPKAMGIASATMNFSAEAPSAAANAVVLNQNGVQWLNTAGEPMYAANVVDVTERTVLAVAADGKVAVGGPGNRVELLSAGGKSERVLVTTAAVDQLLWSNDGRVASAEGQLVNVYNAANGQPEFSVDAPGSREMAFATDGRLAVLNRQPDGKAVLLMNQNKVTAWKSEIALSGSGLAFVAGGDVVVAGNQAYDRSGQPVWQAPLTPRGVLPLGGDRVLFWDGKKAMALDGRSGYVIWEAALDLSGLLSRLAPSPDGRFVAITARTERGGVLWVLNSTGATRHSEMLDEMPVDLTFVGNRLLLVLPHSTSVLELGQ